MLSQILNLDCQSLENRLKSLETGPLIASGQLLDKMIDIAASLKAKTKRRLASDSVDAFNAAEQVAASVDGDRNLDETDQGGAVPDWFLDEMDRIEERCGRMRDLQIFAAQSCQQWRQ